MGIFGRKEGEGRRERFPGEAKAEMRSGGSTGAIMVLEEKLEQEKHERAAEEIVRRTREYRKQNPDSRYEPK